MKKNTELHLQNIFDILDPTGEGVTGELKQLCIDLQNRSVGFSDDGDSVVISEDCPHEFVEYMIKVKQIQSLSFIRVNAGSIGNDKLNADSIFSQLISKNNWKDIVEGETRLAPYIKTPHIYQAAKRSKLYISDYEWDTFAKSKIILDMNDKAKLYVSCEENGIRVPKFWIASKKNIVDTLYRITKDGFSNLYIRPALSGGGFGNITIDFTNGFFFIRERPVIGGLNKEEFAVFMASTYLKENTSQNYVVSVLLDVITSPGTLFYVDDSIRIVGHTVQRLSSTKHYVGFEYEKKPTSLSRVFLDQAEEMIQVLIEPWRQKGYRGFGNLDWMIGRDNKIYVAEINARKTAVVPPLMIASQVLKKYDYSNIMPPEKTVMTEEHFPLRHRTNFNELIKKLRTENLLWDAQKKLGIIITIPPTLSSDLKKTGLMMLGDDLQTVHKLYKKAKGIL